MGSGAESCCGGVWRRFLRVGWFWVSGGMIGEAICVGVSDGKWNLMATRRGGVPILGLVRQVRCFPYVLPSGVERLQQLCECR